MCVVSEVASSIILLMLLVAEIWLGNYLGQDMLSKGLGSEARKNTYLTTVAFGTLRDEHILRSSFRSVLWWLLNVLYQVREIDCLPKQRRGVRLERAIQGHRSNQWRSHPPKNVKPR